MLTESWFGFPPLREEKRKKKGKGKRDPGQMHLERVPGRSRERQKFAERQKDH